MPSDGEDVVAEFMASIETAAAKLPEAKSIIALKIAQQSSVDLNIAAAALYRCGLGDLLKPIDDHEDIFRTIVRGVLDEDGNDYLDNEDNGIRGSAVAIFFSFARVFSTLDASDDFIDVPRLFAEGSDVRMML